MNKDLKSYWGWFLAWGIGTTLLGLFAISAATFTTMASVVLIGILLAIGGAILIVDTFAFWWGKWSGFLIHLLISLLYLYVGILLVRDPVAGSASLTLILGVFYIIVGGFRLLYALSMRVSKWQWTFVNGLISLLLGILIVTNLPSASLFIIGLFVGIDLLFCGLAYIMIALSARSLISN